MKKPYLSSVTPLTVDELTGLVASIIEFLRVHSDASLIEAEPRWPHDEAYAMPWELRVGYSLRAGFLGDVGTSLDAPLFALLRAQQCVSPEVPRGFHLYVETIRTVEADSFEEQSALIISIPSDTDRGQCIRWVNKLLQWLLYPSAIRPLRSHERRVFMRSPLEP